MKVNTDIRSDIIEKIYKDGDLNFTQKYLTTITSKLKMYIFNQEYKKGNIDFVYRNFSELDSGELKETIITNSINERNMKFLYENYQYIDDKDIKEQIIKVAYKEENVDFLNQHLEDMPKSLKLEAAIKFKDLNLTKEELEALLKR